MRANNIKTMKWVARIWSGLIILFLLFFFIGYLVQDIMNGDPLIIPTNKEALGLIFFPLGLFLGFILAWKREGLGGLISIISMICFHITMFIVTGNPNFEKFIDIFAAPGLLFVVVWYFSRNGERLNININDKIYKGN